MQPPQLRREPLLMLPPPPSSVYRQQTPSRPTFGSRYGALPSYRISAGRRLLQSSNLFLTGRAPCAVRHLPDLATLHPKKEALEPCIVKAGTSPWRFLIPDDRYSLTRLSFPYACLDSCVENTMTRDTLYSLPVISEECSNNVPTLGDPTDSSIVMAEQSSHDVVTQTRSGGEPSPSDVPASNSDKNTAGGDVGEIKDTATTEYNERPTNTEHDLKLDAVDAAPGVDDAGNASGRSTAVSPYDRIHPPTGLLNREQDHTKDGPGPVEARALELNGVASGSDRGEDTGSQGGSESDTSRTDGRYHGRTGSVKKTASFKPVSFAKFNVPKTPGSVLTSKIVSEKGLLCSLDSYMYNGSY